MKTRRYSEEQVFRILKEVDDGCPVVDELIEVFALSFGKLFNCKIVSDKQIEHS